jgi:hypothetical protein
MRKSDRVIRALGYIAAAVLGAALLLVLLRASGIQSRVKEDISFADFTAVILSALGVMVAILTFFLAVLAIFGWSAFRTIIEDKSEELFRRRFDANNPEYGALVNQLVEDAHAQMTAAAIAAAQGAEDPDLNDDAIMEGELGPGEEPA